MKTLFVLIGICLSVISLKAQAQDIDASISLPEIEKYGSRITLHRLPDVSITHADTYKIRTRQSVYSSHMPKITLDVINVDGPTVEPEQHRLEQWENGRWITFPFIDFLIFDGVGRNLSKGDTLPEYIYPSEFKYSLKPNKYKVHFYVFTNISTFCTLTNDSIQPVKGSEMQGAFSFRIVSSSKDSIRIQFANHTNLPVQPVFLPGIETENTYNAHPFARSGWSGEADWMKKHARLEGGQALLFTIPTAWKVNRIRNSSDRKKYRSGKLAPGTYKIGLQLKVYMNTEFEVK